MRHSGYVRNFESMLRMLCDRGHRVHVAFQSKPKYAQLDPADIASCLAEQYPNFSHQQVPLRSDGWGQLGREVRLGLDYLRYLEPEYRNAPKLRERARRGVSAAMLQRTERGFFGTRVGRRALARWLRLIDRAIPRDPRIDAFIHKVRPDVVAVTPLIEPGAPQVDFLRSARAFGIPVAYCVASWDNLTNKGLIHGPVDLVTVWNEEMKREAVKFHRIPPGKVLVTGAAAFDHWFDWRPSTTREAFCSRVGLPADRPYLLYLCSSKFVAPDEVPFVRAWIEHIRSASAKVLPQVGILVRPHPQHAEQWQGVEFDGLGPVAIWPRSGAAPVDTTSRGEYFDSIYHSAAVVGINTTAEIESAIVGRGVYTILAPEFRETQEGTLHFRHLQRVSGGLVRVARDFAEHLAHLEAAVSKPETETDDPRCRRFVEAFVRPYGLDVPATPKLVDALEALARTRLRPEREPAWVLLVRSRLAGRAARLDALAEAATAVRTAREAAKRARRQALEAERRAQAAEEARREAEKARREAVRRAKLAEGIGLTRDERVEALVTGFQRLGEVDRRKFLRAITDGIPATSFIELHAAAKPRRLDYDRCEILMHVATESEELRLRACAKEPFTVEWIHRWIAPGEVLYDIGANVGAYSLIAAKQSGGGARVYAFEPGYASMASLHANVVLNGVGDLVTPLPIALSNRTGMEALGLRDLEPGAARHIFGASSPGDEPVVCRQPALTCRLDDAVEWFQLPPPNHIKLDVDGGELAVLEGAPRTLDSPGLRSMLVEVSMSLSDAVTEMLERYRFRLWSKVEVKNKAGVYAVWYGVFVRDGALQTDRPASGVDTDASRWAKEQHP
jgi:FkbM family methyltransferase